MWQSEAKLSGIAGDVTQKKTGFFSRYPHHVTANLEYSVAGSFNRIFNLVISSPSLVTFHHSALSPR